MEPSYLSQRSQCQQIKSMLCDAIKVLCSNTVSYGNCLSIEALIGITVDNSEVILINVQEILEKEKEESVDQEFHFNNKGTQIELDLTTVSGDGCLKVDPTTDGRLFEILTNEVIQIDDEEKKDFADIRASICIKEEDQFDCLIEGGHYNDGEEVFQNNDSSQLQTENNEFYSDECNDQYNYNSNIIETFPSTEQQYRRGNRAVGPFNCRICKKTFISQLIYLRHKKKHQQSSVTTTTAFCEQEMLEINSGNKRAGVLSESWLTAVPSGKKRMVLSQEVTNMTVYTCSICGKTIRHQSSFLRHKRQHEGIVYKCDLCGAVISRRDALQVHKRKCAMRLQQMSSSSF